MHLEHLRESLLLFKTALPLSMFDAYTLSGSYIPAPVAHIKFGYRSLCVP